MKAGKFILVGAGPGDPELISLKGVKALQLAEVVLYDALIHPDILKHINVSAEVVFVGKKKGVCQFPQERINQLIVDHALQGKTVVRLKGGDPFIFGRGHEEMTYAKAFNIVTEVVPGISSIYSVAELQGIPLTRRGVNESFWVVTGTTKSHELSKDIYLAAQSNATVVILMGMTKLTEIVSVFTNEGKENIPVAIIQNGSMPDEKIALGYVYNIIEEVEKAKLSSPAVIIVGEVVRVHPHFQNTLTEKSIIQQELRAIAAQVTEGSHGK